MLIRPTNSTNLIFYTLFCCNTSLINYPALNSTVFKKTRTNGVLSWTEFSSTYSSKFENLVRCEITMLIMTSCWMEFFRIKFLNQGVKYNLIEVFSSSCFDELNNMLALSCLIYMNAKTKAEEVITNSIFIFMEGFVTCPALAKPHKMTEKFPTVIRSRLQAWETNKQLEAMARIVAQGKFNLQTRDG